MKKIYEGQIPNKAIELQLPAAIWIISVNPPETITGEYWLPPVVPIPNSPFVLSPQERRVPFSVNCEKKILEREKWKKFTYCERMI